MCLAQMLKLNIDCSVTRKAAHMIAAIQQGNQRLIEYFTQQTATNIHNNNTNSKL